MQRTHIVTSVVYTVQNGLVQAELYVNNNVIMIMIMSSTACLRWFSEPTAAFQMLTHLLP